jgi:hypothetical protein
MLSRKLLMRIVLASFVLALLFGIGAAIGLRAPGAVEQAVACNPCDCENDRRLNCQGIEFYAVYVRTYNDPNITCAFEMYRIDANGGLGRPVMRVNNVTLGRFPASNVNQLIRQNQGIAIYRLTSGELQINAGPDAEGKIYTLRIDGCPPTTRVEGSYIQGR